MQHQLTTDRDGFANWPPTKDQRDDLRDAILRELAGEYPLPVSTNELADRLGVPGGPWHQELWRQLDRFARRREVERVKRDGMFCRYWRLAPDVTVVTSKAPASPASPASPADPAGTALLMCGDAPMTRPAGDAATVTINAYVCPWCGGTGKWQPEHERCHHCGSSGVTNETTPGVDFSRDHGPGVEPPEVAPVPLPRPPAIMRAPCLDCAYRPGSPEEDSTARPDGSTPFFCHHGMARVDHPDGQVSYQPAAWIGDKPLGYFVCAGWWDAFVAGKGAPAAPFRDPGGADRASAPALPGGGS